MRQEPAFIEAFAHFLLGRVTPNKKKRFEEAIAYRTRYLTVVLEDIFQPHNASAVVRTCDCYGLQDLHVIEEKYPYILSDQVTSGASKWVTINRYPTRLSAIERLKQEGYLLVATSPSNSSHSLHELPLDRKFALGFGTEKYGLSDEFVAAADYHMHIPMYGFTESFNISVSAAISISHLVTRLHGSPIAWQLSEEEKYRTLVQWCMTNLKDGLVLEKEFTLQWHKHRESL